VPGRVDDEWTFAVIDALRRDDPGELPSDGGRLDLRTLLEMGFDIVPLLTSDLRWCVMAVELNARNCALLKADFALRHATVRGSALEPLLLEALGGPDELRKFQVAHGTSLAMTPYIGEEDFVWDAELALALYEEGLDSSLARVGEPTHAGSWWTFAMNAPPAKRRKLLKSTNRAGELLELFEVAWADPTQVMRWLVEGYDRLLAWNELGSALDVSSEFLWTQSLFGVDLAKVANVFERLDFPRAPADGVLKALVDGGLDDLAVEVEAKLPPGCAESWSCDWSHLGARALLGGAFQFVTALLRPRGDRAVLGQDVAKATHARLRELGRDTAAAAFAAAFSSTLADRGSEEAFEGDRSEEANEGRLLAMKLRECSVLAL
jgi:hypothetical protein